VASTGIDELSEAVLDAAWIQWRSLGSFVDSRRVAQSIIDPEALLLISLSLRDHERRLWDVLGSWAANGSRIFSVQRVKNLRRRFPDQVNDQLAEFATLAVNAGKDHRWRRMADTDPGPTVRSQDLWKAHPSRWDPTALVVRLRLGIGVGAVADLLSFIISLNGNWAGAPAIAEATDYSVYAIRRAADNMAGAQLIERAGEKPIRYRADAEAWRDLLGIEEDLPGWRFWQKIYSFAATLIHRDDIKEWEDKSPYLISSSFRDIYEEYEDAFVLNHIGFADPSKFPGAEYSPAFEDSIVHLANWIRDHV
jgi:hypothetical protein